MAFTRARIVALVAALTASACGVASEPTATVKERDSTGPTAAFDWAVTDRFQASTWWLNPVPPSNQLLDTGWDVTLSGCLSTAPTDVWDPIVDYAWDVNLPAGNLHIDAGDSCSYPMQFPSQGVYNVTLTVTTLSGATAATNGYITVRDILIVSIGDSVASGEGNPDSLESEVNAEGLEGEIQPVFWTDRRCHRSGWSGAAQGAQGLEALGSHYGVTFLSVACSGASIDAGLAGPYAGEENPDNLPDLPSQIQQVAQALCPKPGGVGCSRDDLRNIDALMIQVGANDIGFSNIVRTCANPVETCADNGDFTSGVQNAIANLPNEYALLNQQLTSSLKYSSVYIGEYFDPTHDQYGNICSDMILEGAAADQYAILGYTTLEDGDINSTDAAWAYNDVILPLNAAVQSAANAYGWNYVGGIASQFATHGYCIAAILNQRWIRHYGESKTDQGNIDGTMHPNIYGQAVYSQAFSSAMYPITASPHMTGVWTPTVLPQMRTYDLTAEALEGMWTPLTNQGQRIQLLTPYVLDNDQVRFNVVWEPTSEAQTYVIEYSLSDFINLYNSLWNDGWRLKVLNSVVLPGNDVRYNAVWELNWSGEIQVYGWAYSDLQNLYNQLWGEGWRIKILNSYVLTGDQVLYNAVWQQSTAGEIQVYGWAYSDYRNFYDQLWNDGWRLKTLDTYVMSGEQVRYNATWQPGWGSETQVYEYGDEAFRSTDDTFQSQGWSLEILASSITH